jgi:hypothetical protein
MTLAQTLPRLSHRMRGHGWISQGRAIVALTLDALQ